MDLLPSTIILLAQTESKLVAEIWLTPLILLPGVALLIGSTSSRFGQLHAEFHRLLEHHDAHAQILARNLVHRSRLFRDALASLYISVGLFALGSLVGAFVNFFWPATLWVIGSFTLVGIGFLVFAATQLLRESRVCLEVIRKLSDSISNNGGKE